MYAIVTVNLSYATCTRSRYPVAHFEESLRRMCIMSPRFLDTGYDAKELCFLTSACSYITLMSSFWILFPKACQSDIADLKASHLMITPSKSSRVWNALSPTSGSPLTKLRPSSYHCPENCDMYQVLIMLANCYS